VAVAGQAGIAADQTGDTLTIAAGQNIALTTNAATDTLTVAVSGLATVAASGAYGDLSGKPTLGTASTQDVGSGVQAYSAKLAALAGVTGGADTLPYFTGVSSMGATPLSSFARTLLDDTDAATARATLGVTAGGWEVVSAVSASGASSVDWTGLVSGYDYMISGHAISQGTNALAVRVGTGATPTWQTTNYGMLHGRLYAEPNTGTIAWAYPPTTALGLCETYTGADIIVGCECLFMNPGGSQARKYARATGFVYWGGSYESRISHLSYNSATPITALRVLNMSGNTITGEFILRRLKRS
jgi:hypothetical protein